MEENISILPPTFKLYKDRAVFLAAFLGGPLGAGYLIAENFKALDEPEKAKTTWIIAIAVILVLFGGLIVIPTPEKMPQYIIPIAYSYAAYAIVQKYQGIDLKAHVLRGGTFYPMWRAALVALIGLMIMFAFIVVLGIIKEAI
jgi:hypothetical protein